MSQPVGEPPYNTPPASSPLPQKGVLLTHTGETRRVSVDQENNVTQLLSEHGGLQQITKSHASNTFEFSADYEQAASTTETTPSSQKVQRAAHSRSVTRAAPSESEEEAEGIELTTMPSTQELSQLVEDIKKNHPDLSKELANQIDALQQNDQKRREMLKSNPNHSKIEELENQILQEQRQLSSLITAAKSARVADEKLEEMGVEIARGKAKVVHRFKAHPGYVFYTPVPSLLGAKRREIRQEVAKAKDIKSNLYRKGLKQVLMEKAISGHEALANKIAARYPTYEEWMKALDAGEEELTKKLGISKEVASKLLEFGNEWKGIASKWKGLAVELTEVPSPTEAKAYAVKTEEAITDLEHQIQKPVDLATRVQYSSQFLHAMAALAEAGYVHGDPKPENVLVYEEGLKVADWGKTGPAGKGSYTGNLRFAAPEKAMTLESDVYSAAMIVIRILEENLLEEETQMIDGDPTKKDPSSIPPSKRRGIEKFAVVNGAMTQNESSLKGRVRNFASSYTPSALAKTPNLAEAEKEMHDYIDLLVKKLVEQRGLPVEKGAELKSLLCAMTLSDPTKRPNMADAAKTFDDIGLKPGLSVGST